MKRGGTREKWQEKGPKLASPPGQIVEILRIFQFSNFNSQLFQRFVGTHTAQLRGVAFLLELGLIPPLGFLLRGL